MSKDLFLDVCRDRQQNSLKGCNASVSKDLLVLSVGTDSRTSPDENDAVNINVFGKSLKGGQILS